MYISIFRSKCYYMYKRYRRCLTRWTWFNAGLTRRKGQRVNCYASCCVFDVECRYSQTKKEAGALVWACEWFHMYLHWKEFELLTDHKPLHLFSFQDQKSMLVNWDMFCACSLTNTKLCIYLDHKMLQIVYPDYLIITNKMTKHYMRKQNNTFVWFWKDLHLLPWQPVKLKELHRRTVTLNKGRSASSLEIGTI